MLLKEKYSYVRVGTLVAMHITDILTKNSFFGVRQRLTFKKMKKTHNDMKFSVKW